MAGKKNSAILARRQARERLAHERAEQAERNKKNEEDLVDYLTLEQRIASADADRDTAMRTVQERHEVAVKELKQRQAACLARMSQRGEKTSAVADRTGLTVRDVKHLIGRVRPAISPVPRMGKMARTSSAPEGELSGEPVEN